MFFNQRFLGVDFISCRLCFFHYHVELEVICFNNLTYQCVILTNVC